MCGVNREPLHSHKLERILLFTVYYFALYSNLNMSLCNDESMNVMSTFIRYFTS